MTSVTICIFLAVLPLAFAQYGVPVYWAFDVDGPPNGPNGPMGPNGPGISLTTGSAGFVQSADSDPFMNIPSMGGPMDLDPADYPSGPPPFGMGPDGSQGGQMPGSDGSQGGQQPGSNLGPFPPQPQGLSNVDVTAFDFAQMDPRRHGNFPPPVLNNQASGTVINTGSAATGSLNAAGNSKTNTGRFGSQSVGTGALRGQGIGLSGTEVDSGSAGTGSTFPGGFPSSGSSSNTFLNSMQAAKGRISGNSNTISRTGPGGNAFGQSDGTAQAAGQGVQLSQVANSDSQGSGVGASSWPWNQPSTF